MERSSPNHSCSQVLRKPRCRFFAWPLVLWLFGSTGCGETKPTINIVAYKKEVVADDGYGLKAFDLHLKGNPPDESPQAWMFYLVGSEPVSILDSMAQYAELIAQGFVVVLVQPRGVSADGTIDRKIFRQYETRGRRVADQHSVLAAYVGGAAGAKVLLVGSSQSGVVASEVAADNGLVTHLLMMASGGGWNQAEEMTHHVQRGQGPVPTVQDLNAQFDLIRASPASDTMWLGHPYRMWSSYLWYRPLDSLKKRSIPMFLAQGTEDRATPVESARVLRDEFARLGLGNLTYAEYPGLDHHFNDAAGESRLLDLQAGVFAWMAQNGLLQQTR